MQRVLWKTNKTGKIEKYEELHEFLISKGFIASPKCPSMYTRRNEDGSLVKLLNYADDMLYF